MRTNALLQCCRSTRSLLPSSWKPSRTFIATQSPWEKTHLQITSCSSSSSSSSSSSLPHFSHLVQFPTKPTSSFTSSGALRFYNAKPSTHSDETDKEDEYPLQDESSDGESTDGWEEEDETEPQIGDGGDGGGVVLQNVPWGGRVLSIANEVLLQFGDDMKLYSFKTSPRGYIYVRLDKLSNNYGCPSMEEIENYSCLYKKKLEEVGESGEIPDDLALEVSSPGAERLLRVPDDLERFKEMPMRVSYVEGDLGTKSPEKDGVFFLEALEVDSGECVWRLADVKENRDALGKGRPFGRKQKDWRLRVPFEGVKRVTLYLEY